MFMRHHWDSNIVPQSLKEDVGQYVYLIPDCVTDQNLVVAKVRERLEVSKQSKAITRDRG